MLTFTVIREFIDPEFQSFWTGASENEKPFEERHPILNGIRKTVFPTQQELKDAYDRRAEMQQQMKAETEKYGNTSGIGFGYGDLEDYF